MDHVAEYMRYDIPEFKDAIKVGHGQRVLRCGNTLVCSTSLLQATQIIALRHSTSTSCIAAYFHNTLLN